MKAAALCSMPSSSCSMSTAQSSTKSAQRCSHSMYAIINSRSACGSPKNNVGLRRRNIASQTPSISTAKCSPTGIAQAQIDRVSERHSPHNGAASQLPTARCCQTVPLPFSRQRPVFLSQQQSAGGSRPVSLRSRRHRRARPAHVPTTIAGQCPRAKKRSGT
eukprot:COSAG02_NODE_4243_length_5593_cov_32.867674_4_plen_162_part_00